VGGDYCRLNGLNIMLTYFIQHYNNCIHDINDIAIGIGIATATMGLLSGYSHTVERII
jgi:hypothetical protein